MLLPVCFEYESDRIPFLRWRWQLCPSVFLWHTRHVFDILGTMCVTLQTLHNCIILVESFVSLLCSLCHCNESVSSQLRWLWVMRLCNIKWGNLIQPVRFSTTELAPHRYIVLFTPHQLLNRIPNESVRPSPCGDDLYMSQSACSPFTRCCVALNVGHVRRLCLQSEEMK